MKVSLITALLSMAAMLLSSTVRAEYYMTRDASQGCYSSCYQTCCQSCCHGCIATQTKTKVSHDSWRSYDNRHNSYTIDVITTDCFISNGFGANTTRDTKKHAFVTFSNAPAARGHYVDLSNNPYDPDLTTADDEVMEYSGMNNQY